MKKMEGATSQHSSPASTTSSRKEPSASATDAEPDSKPQPSETRDSCHDDSADGLVSKTGSSSALKPVLDTFEMYLADKRTVQMKRSLSIGVFQVVNGLCSCLEEGNKEKIIRDICNALLTNQMKSLHLLYRFLGEVFRG